MFLAWFAVVVMTVVGGFFVVFAIFCWHFFTGS